jgi:hypothetical protein
MTLNLHHPFGELVFIMVNTCTKSDGGVPVLFQKEHQDKWEKLSMAVNNYLELPYDSFGKG